MNDLKTLDRLEDRLVSLVDGMLIRKASQIDFLVLLNRLDDILTAIQNGKQIVTSLSALLIEFPDTADHLSSAQRGRLGQLLTALYGQLVQHDDLDHRKLAEEVKNKLQAFGGRITRLSLKRPEEKASLTDRFRLLMHRETQEMAELVEKNGHLLTCLDDLLKTAEIRDDVIYRHMAAAIVYFLQMEGYKVGPYVKKLRDLEKSCD